LRGGVIMGKWLSKFKNNPETPIQRTDITDTSQVVDFASEAEKVREHLQRYGLARIRSETLGEDVFFAVDERAAGKAPSGAVIYDVNELRELAWGNLTRDDLKQLHQIKKIFNGTIIPGGKTAFRWGSAV